MMIHGIYTLNKGAIIMNTLFKILMIIGILLLLYNAAASPENALFFFVSGGILSIFSGFALALNSKKDNSK